VAGQCLLSPISLETRINNSDMVVEGRVIAKKYYWDEKHEHIFTSNTVEVYKVLKGNWVTQIDIITQGGTVGNEAEKVFPALNLEMDATGIFTCVTTATILSDQLLTRYEAYADVQGFIKYEDENAIDAFNKYKKGDELYNSIKAITNAEIKIIEVPKIEKRISSATPVVSGFSPSSINAGIHSVITITGNGFGDNRDNSVVSFKNCDDGGKTYINALPTQYKSWSDTEIKVELPANAGNGTIKVNNTISVNVLSVPYSQLNVGNSSSYAFQANHINQSGNGGYIWSINSSFDAKNDAKAAFLRAFNNWRCATGVNWSIGAVTSNNATARDDENVIRFDVGAQLKPGVLGACYSYYKGCASENVWYVSELDIVFDDAANWNFSANQPPVGTYDFESVVVHELGHGHQLGHVIDNSDLMNWALSSATAKRVIGNNNKACAENVMAQSIIDNSCGPTAMIALDSLRCDDPYASYAVSEFSVNPTLFDKILHVKYHLRGKHKVLVAIYNLSGTQVAVFRNEYQETGGYDYNFDVGSLNLHGIYFLEVAEGSNSLSKKIFKQ
jgi:hypothetical protein